MSLPIGVRTLSVLRAGRDFFFFPKAVSLEDVEEVSGHSGFSSIEVLREDPGPKL